MKNLKTLLTLLALALNYLSFAQNGTYTFNANGIVEVEDLGKTKEPNNKKAESTTVTITDKTIQFSGRKYIYNIVEKKVGKDFITYQTLRPEEGGYNSDHDIHIAKDFKKVYLGVELNDVGPAYIIYFTDNSLSATRADKVQNTTQSNQSKPTTTTGQNTAKFDNTTLNVYSPSGQKLYAIYHQSEFNRDKEGADKLLAFNSKVAIVQTASGQNLLIVPMTQDRSYTQNQKIGVLPDGSVKFYELREDCIVTLCQHCNPKERKWTFRGDYIW